MIRLSVENGLRALLGAFILGCIFITTSYNTTFAFDHPLHTAVLACFNSGISLLLLSRFVQRIPSISPPPDKYSAIPLTELDQSTPTGVDDDASKDQYTLKWWFRIAVFSGICCARVAIFRYVTNHIECAPPGRTYLTPLFITLYDAWRNQRASERWVRPDQSEDAILRIPLTLASRIRYFVLQSRLRNVISAAFLVASGLIIDSFDKSQQSTYICTIVSGQHFRQQTLRTLGLILDSTILIFAAELSGDVARREGRRKQALLSWGYGLLGVVLFLGGWVIALTVTAEPGTYITSHYLRSAWGQSVLVTIVIVSASQLYPQYGLPGLCILAGFVANYFHLTSILFNGQEPFPLILASRAFTALSVTCAGSLVFLLSRTASEDEPQFMHRFNWILRFTCVILFGTGLFWVMGQSSVGHTHPIDLLIHEAAKNHDEWMKGARSSNNLAEAVQQYQARYNQHPPPNFDKWYDYAASRSSVTIDEFDSIHTNLVPFRAIPPSELRTLTQKLATNPFNDIGALSIRNGTVRLQDGIKPTHAWMVGSARQMIEKFSEHLPDMDLAFNLDDEPRVIAPWERVAGLVNQAQAQQRPSDAEISNEWSADRDTTWAPIEPADQTPEPMFIDHSLQAVWDSFVAPACPPGSKARSQRIWDRHSLCIGCTRPHSMGQFPTAWDLTTDVCHQPDLAHLHGLFLSPATFRITQELLPVFSQSTASIFSDIVFPSPWNYVDKIKYEPSDEHPDVKYADKENTLFWIGGTTEGVSHDGRWQGMPRQRFAHLVNNNTYNHVSVLLPTDEPKTFAYQVFDGFGPSQILGLNASAGVTDPILRCIREDCDDQKNELGLGGRVDFQDHWHYRYLFDSDGAGFSGRFLPFLKSRSIPFKTGLFRQWFDSRITPWLHYAPIDVRLHGLWSTLAYFAGIDTTIDGHKVQMKRHDIQGRWIAEEGRRWAETALRKEDMEIYFFRLLLEWGRLTDDRRDTLGFKLPA
ncbi:putative capsular associated protein [Aspergillus stella-maris]|uniref:putative capsular associated protein n=1 Tax=Aspergillus stella-maris TaxID=1810926 RepID=UPI003CCCD1BE